MLNFVSASIRPLGTASENLSLRRDLTSWRAARSSSLDQKRTLKRVQDDGGKGPCHRARDCRMSAANQEESAVAKFKMIALTTPVSGKEAEYHEWYQKVHLPQLCSFAGIDSAQRYKLVAKMIGNDTNQYLAVYDIETDDAMKLMGAIGEASAAGKLTQTDASDMGTTYTALFEAFDDVVTG
jgi:hypothetical protein